MKIDLIFLFRQQSKPSLSVMMKMAQKKKKMAFDAKQRNQIKVEEEISQRNVKTLIDAEAADLERKKIEKTR